MDLAHPRRRRARSCGWLKDKFGVSWQIVPKDLPELINGSDRAGAGRAMQAMLADDQARLAELREAYEGVPA